MSRSLSLLALLALGFSLHASAAEVSCRALKSSRYEQFCAEYVYSDFEASGDALVTVRRPYWVLPNGEKVWVSIADKKKVCRTVIGRGGRVALGALPCVRDGRVVIARLTCFERG